MIKRWQVGSVCGVLGVLVYVTLACIAYLHYPDAYSPLTNALSQLGSPPLNPAGAIFYNLGGILLGLLLLPFYLDMSRWNTSSRSQKILIAGAQAAGIISSLALISSCVFPAGTHTPIHVASAGTAMLSSVFFWIFSGFGMLKNPAGVKWISYFGYVPLVGISIIVFVLKQRFLVEWVAVSLFLVYVLLLAYNGPKMSKFAAGRANIGR